MNISLFSASSPRSLLRCIVTALALAATFLTPALLRAQNPAAPAEGGGNILEVAKAAGNFETFLKAVKAAGLTDALHAAGPMTVFLPTDEAFTKLPAGTLDNLLDPKNVDKLKSTLSYHVAPRKWTAAEISKVDEIKTLGPTEIDVDASADGKTIELDDAKIVKTDLAASNGLIQVIDRVLQP